MSRIHPCVERSGYAGRVSNAAKDSEASSTTVDSDELTEESLGGVAGGGPMIQPGGAHSVTGTHSEILPETLGGHTGIRATGW